MVYVENNGGPTRDYSLDRMPATLAELINLFKFLPKARSPKPYVVFSFDDNPKQDITVVKPMLDSKGVKATFAVVSDWVESAAGQLSWADVRQLQNEGHEISNHSKTHLNLTAGYTNAQLNSELKDAHNALIQKGIKPLGFTYSYGTHDTTIRDAVKGLGYTYGLSVVGTANTPPLKTFGLKRVSFNTTSTLVSHQAQVDSALASNEILVFLTHSASELDAGAIQKFSDLVDYIRSKGIDIVTAADAVAANGNILEAGDIITGTSYSILDASGNLSHSSIVTPAIRTEGNTDAAGGATRLARTPSAYLNGTTLSQIPSGSAGSPSTDAGVLKTERVGDQYYCTQEYTTVIGTLAKYVRSGSGSWGTWKQVTLT